MVDEVDELTYVEGIATIRREIDSRLSQFNVERPEVLQLPSGPLDPVIFQIKACDKQAESEFSSEEIENSARAIVHSAATKVSHLVSHFVL